MMDYDVEMDDVQDKAEVIQVPAAYTEDIITGEEQEPGEVEDVETENHGIPEATESTVVPYKIHIRGLDTFKPDDVKAYVTEHHSAGRLVSIEWIDDSSANLIFRSESNAQEALVALASVEIAHASQLSPHESIPAKGFAAKPDSILQVRFAFASDKKPANAAARSRFYLLHPEFDPEERHRRGDFDRRYRDRDGGYVRQKRRGGRRCSKYEYDDEEKAFDVNLYDDDVKTLAKRTSRRPRSPRDSVSTRSSESEHMRHQPDGRNRDRELLPGWKARDGTSRGRSASPVRSGDRDDAIDKDENYRAAASMRNREKARAIKERLSLENSNRELFHGKAGRDDKSTKELFPAKIGAPAGGVAQMDQLDDSTILSSAKLADRITPRESSSTFSIRGMASKRASSQGFAIKGTGASVKELFPDRFGNAGKELFADRSREPRRTMQTRQKAQDLFY